MPKLSPLHKTTKHKQHKGSDPRTKYAHLYGRAWQKYRKSFLAQNPLCVCDDCKDKTSPAEVVDHIIPHRGDTRLFWDRDNHQALTKRCHDRKTMKEVRARSGI